MLDFDTYFRPAAIFPLISFKKRQKLVDNVDSFMLK